MTKASDYLKEVLAKPVEFFDYKKMDKGSWETYKADAKFILESEVFNNEINHIITDTLKNTVMASKDFSQVEQARTYILALEELKERLRSVEEPTGPQPPEEPHSAI